ncbi:helix-turn-helix domain-containing protein [Streptomyces sp. DSM 42041]|uniref:Helix-turn-helix domain-containing protein n=1 Tax=Streptomyces hazeniae TaxID=3075538 RepID=A0ABU2NSJ4_9ACTN|nr:helix-turn-helix domain-containing protein [Streptomyces sp. DSM 42041]MDT0379951.1 helix-turn-helix domain-containing protein [Streptomyces sp. DSM 42041]
MEQHLSSTREEALTLLRRGTPNREVSDLLGVPRGTVGWWRYEDRRALGELFERTHDCPRCSTQEVDGPWYAYLLGLYLGDGHIIRKPKQNHLSVFCDLKWPGLIDAAEEAMRCVMRMPSIHRRVRNGCAEVKSVSTHWPCLFPQHGPGKKHDRLIALEPWQQEIVDAHPWELIRGLIHSDGCRITNWTTRMVGGERKRYEYPRYFFTNKSDDIRRIFTDTLRRVGVEWTVLARGHDPFNVSIARRASVALMDAHVGPKY